MRAAGRVLIFSQMVRVLDIISDYMRLRGFQHQRLDGSTPAGARHQVPPLLSLGFRVFSPVERGTWDRVETVHLVVIIGDYMGVTYRWVCSRSDWVGRRVCPIRYWVFYIYIPSVHSALVRGYQQVIYGNAGRLSSRYRQADWRSCLLQASQSTRRKATRPPIPSF